MQDLPEWARTAVATAAVGAGWLLPDEHYLVRCTVACAGIAGATFLPLPEAHSADQGWQGRGRRFAYLGVGCGMFAIFAEQLMNEGAEWRPLRYLLPMVGLQVVGYLETGLKDATAAAMAALVLVCLWFLYEAPGLSALLTSDLAYIVVLVLACGCVARVGDSSTKRSLEEQY